MARLPFQQATVLPQQNRLQAPSVPNAPGPMPTQVPGANARYQALQSLGESIAKIGRTAADIYLTQAEKEQDEQAKIDIVQSGQQLDQGFNGFLLDMEQNPPEDMADAMARYEYFLDGGDKKDPKAPGMRQMLLEGLKDKPKRVQDAVTRMLDNKEIQTRQVLALQEVRRSQSFQENKSLDNAQALLGQYLQDLEPESFLVSADATPTQRRQEIAAKLQEVVNPALEGLAPAIRQRVETRLNANLDSTGISIFQAQEEATKNELRKSFAQAEVNLAKSPAPRFQRMALYEALQQQQVNEQLKAPERAVADIAKFESSLDNTDFDRRLLEDPAALLEDLLNNEEAFPTFRENRFQKIRELQNYISGQRSKGISEARRQIGFAVTAILSPELSPERRAELESPGFIQEAISQLVNEEERVIAGGLHNYAIETHQALKVAPTATLAELTQLKRDLTPPLFIDGVDNLDIDKFRTIYKGTTDYIEQIEKARKGNGAAFYQMPEGVDPLDASTLEAVISEQLRYQGVIDPQNLTTNELRRLQITGVNGHKLRTMSDEVLAQEQAKYNGTMNGDERKQYVQRFKQKAGSLYGPMAFTEAASSYKKDGIGLPYYSMLYDEISKPGTLQNFFNAEQNSKTNRANIQQLAPFKQVSLSQLERDISADPVIDEFMRSIQIDPAAVPVANSFREAIVNYVLQLGTQNPDASSDSLIELAGQHLVSDNYAFLNPNNDAPPVRLRNEQLGIYNEYQMSKALEAWTDQWIAKRTAGMADVAAEDNLYAWKPRGDETGLELLNLNPAQGAQASSRRPGVVLSFQELQEITERYVNSYPGENVQLDEASLAEEQQLLQEEEATRQENESTLQRMFRDQRQQDPQEPVLDLTDDSPESQNVLRYLNDLDIAFESTTTEAQARKAMERMVKFGGRKLDTDIEKRTLEQEAMRRLLQFIENR